MSAPAAPRCCTDEFGLDPALVRDSCGFARYLGESEELACVHRFADAEGGEHELRLTPILGSSLEAIAARDRGGGVEVVAPEPSAEGGEGEILRSTTDARHWVAIARGELIHRLGWDRASCSLARMQPAIEAMAAASLPRPDTEASAPLPRLRFAPGPVEIPAHSLLATAAAQSPETSTTSRPLPLGAPALAAALLRSAADAQLERFAAAFDARARWGLPDRRELAARPVADDPAAAMHALRLAAARLPADASFHCPKPDRRSRAALARGEAIMWCLWIDPSQLDLIVLALRGVPPSSADSSAGEPSARVVYLGVFPDAPLAPVSIPGEPPPPPAVWVPPIVCGDPHAIDYPGLCPIDAYVEEDDDDLDHEDQAEDEPEPEPRTHPGERVRVAPPDSP